MPIRVLLVDLKPILHELVEQALRGKADVELVGSWSVSDGGAALMALRPDVAVVPAPEANPTRGYEAVVEALPGTRVLEIGGTATCFVLRDVVPNPGESGLVSAIREAAAARVET